MGSSQGYSKISTLLQKQLVFQNQSSYILGFIIAHVSSSVFYQRCSPCISVLDYHWLGFLNYRHVHILVQAGISGWQDLTRNHGINNCGVDIYFQNYGFFRVKGKPPTYARTALGYSKFHFKVKKNRCILLCIIYVSIHSKLLKIVTAPCLPL